jgi:hypothetical protein
LRSARLIAELLIDRADPNKASSGDRPICLTRQLIAPFIPAWNPA